MSSLRATLLRVALAIGLSFSMWAFVSFSQNPEETVTFPDMQLETVGLADGLVMVDSNGLPNPVLPTVSVTLRTDRAQLASLRTVDVRVVADLEGYSAGEHLISVNVQPTRSNIAFEIVGVEPSKVPIRLEQLSSAPTPLVVEVQGNLPFSFERGEPRVTFGGAPIQEAQVIGPQSRANRVVGARATANIEQLRATYLAPLTLQPIDTAGQVVEGVRLDPPTVTVQIPISPVVGLKLVPVAPAIVGLPAPGYEVRGVAVEPPLIALTGSSGPLDAVDVLSTAPITLDGARQTITRTVSIVFPESTAPNTGEPDRVQVTVQIGPVSQVFQVQLPAQVTVAGLADGLSATVTPQVLTLNLTGSSEALAALGQTPLRAAVDVSGLDAGGYVLTPTIALPPGVTLVGDPPVVQVSLRLPPTTVPATPTADTTSTPAPTPAEGGATAEPASTPTAEPVATATAPAQPPGPSPTP